MTRPFRFAVQAVKARSADEWTAFARRTEELGYSTLFLADHYLGKGPALERAPQPLQHVAPIAAMAAAAAVTSTLRVGCRVFCVDYHVPAVLAKEAATLDLLSGGRLEFGIGAGWNAVEYGAMGLTFGRAARPGRQAEGGRGARSRPSAAVSSSSWRAGTPPPPATRACPSPPQQPHPPIMIGGSRKGVLRFAGREADIVSLNNVDFVPVNDDGLTPREEALRRLGYVRDAAGDRIADLDIESSPFFTRITDDVEGAAAQVAARARRRARRLLLDHPNALFGSADAIADRLLERRETYGVNYVTVQQGELERSRRSSRASPAGPRRPSARELAGGGSPSVAPAERGTTSAASPTTRMMTTRTARQGMRSASRGPARPWRRTSQNRSPRPGTSSVVAPVIVVAKALNMIVCRMIPATCSKSMSPADRAGVGGVVEEVSKERHQRDEGVGGLLRVVEEQLVGELAHARGRAAAGPSSAAAPDRHIR